MESPNLTPLRAGPIVGRSSDVAHVEGHRGCIIDVVRVRRFAGTPYARDTWEPTVLWPDLTAEVLPAVPGEVGKKHVIETARAYIDLQAERYGAITPPSRSADGAGDGADVAVPAEPIPGRLRVIPAETKRAQGLAMRMRERFPGEAGYDLCEALLRRSIMGEDGKRSRKNLEATEVQCIERYLVGLEAGNLAVVRRRVGDFALMHETYCVAVLPTRREAVELAEGRIPAREVA